MPAKPDSSLALVPRYSLLRACGVILQILGFLSLGVGVLMLLSATAYWGGRPTHSTPGDLTSGLMRQMEDNQYSAQAVYGATLLLGGLVYLGIGLFVGLAIDVAKNSYKQTAYLSRLLDRASPPERTA